MDIIILMPIMFMPTSKSFRWVEFGSTAKLPLLFILMILLFGCSGKTKETLFAEGVKEFEQANHAAATVLFKSALQKDSNYQEARYHLAKSYFASGKYELAEKEFKKVALQNPSRTDIPLELAQTHIILKKPDLAIQEVQALGLNTGETLEILGTANALKNSFSEAESLFLQALKAEPKRTSAKVKLAAVYKELGRNSEARRLLDEAIQAEPANFRSYHILADLEVAEGHRDKALDVYGKAAQANPLDPTAPYKKALLHIEKGEMDKAGLIAYDLAARFPKHAEGSRLQGLLKYHAQKYSDALPFLQKSIGIRPTQEANYYIGLCYYSQGDLELALSQFRKIIDVNPSALQARLLTGIILLKQKRVDDSIAEIRKLLQVEPRFALGHNILGSAYMAKGMYDEGMKELNRSLELDPKIVDAHLKKGVFHVKKGKMQEAENEFQAAVHVAPELLNSRLLLSSHYLRQNNHEKALALLKQGINGKKGDAVLLNSMAAIMLAQSKKAEGIEYYIKAKQADPDYLTTYFNLAILYSAANEHEKALLEYGEVLVKSPGNLKAILNTAALLELKGRDSEALKYYKQAVETKATEGYLALANFHIKKSENKKAHSVLDDAVKQISRNVDVLEMKARLYIIEKKYKDALKVYNEIYSFNPDLGLNHKIALYLTMKEAPKALEEARRYILNKPKLAYGYMLQAAVHARQNELDSAIEALHKGVSAEPGNVRALLELGNLYARKNDRKSAMDAYEKALKIDEEFLPAMFAQGVLMESGGDKKRAAQKYREIMNKSDTFMPAINNLAYIYIDDEKLRNLQEGLRLAFYAFRLAPEDPATMDTLGYALVRNGRGTDALKLLEKAKALLPEDPTVAAHLALAKAPPVGHGGSR